jgi:riboflavin synthase
MFTGLVEDVGTAIAAERRSDALVIRVRPGRIALADLIVGESIAHDGVCLTVTDVDREGYGVLAGAETLARTTLGGLRVGDRLNLERALRAGDRLGGHMVAGHVDGTGTIASRVDAGANLVIGIAAPPALLRYIVEKGSIAVDGISLTVNTVSGDDFSVAIIPHTRDETTLGARPLGGRVNLEVDVVAKYVEKLTAGYRGAPP